MGAEATEPIGYPDLPCFHLFDMYTKCTRKDVKKEILQLFTSPVGSLRIVMATSIWTWSQLSKHTADNSLGSSK